jgi:hypothetical protein
MAPAQHGSDQGQVFGWSIEARRVGGDELKQYARQDWCPQAVTPMSGASTRHHRYQEMYCATLIERITAGVVLVFPASMVIAVTQLIEGQAGRGTISCNVLAGKHVLRMRAEQCTTPATWAMRKSPRSQGPRRRNL